LKSITSRLGLFALAGAVLLSTTIGCERKSVQGPADDGGTGPIIIGAYGSLTGPQATFGQSTRKGVDLAIEELNKAGGVLNRQLQVIVEDDQGRPEEASTVVTKLITSDKVVAVIGEVASSNSLAAAPICQQYKIPMISPSSTNEEVTKKGDFIFRVCFIDPFQGEVMAKFAANTLKAKRVAILKDINSDYSAGLTDSFTKAFKGLGGEITGVVSYSQTDSNFNAQLTQVKGMNVDAIYIPGYYTQVGQIVAQARQQGINQPVLGGDGWDSASIWDIGKDALNNCYISNHYSVDDPSPAIQKFIADYKAKYAGEVPDAIAALAYDATKVLAESIKRAGATEGQKLRDAIAQTKDFAGVTGTLTIDANRNAVKPAVVLKMVYENGQGKQVYQETIKP
jgi:branched-chain amino acid transport system substrate-binding protein